MGHAWSLRIGQTELHSNAIIKEGAFCLLTWRYNPTERAHTLFVNGERDVAGEDNDDWPPQSEAAVHGPIKQIAVWNAPLSDDGVRKAWVPPNDPFLGDAEIVESIDGLDFSKVRKNAVLKLVNKSARAALLEAGLNKRAVRNLTKARPLVTIEDLSAVPQIGHAALARLRSHVSKVRFTDEEAMAVLAVVNEAPQETLKKQAKVNARATKNIIEVRSPPDGNGNIGGIDSLDSLEAVAYVGKSVLERLREWAPGWVRAKDAAQTPTVFVPKEPEEAPEMAEPSAPTIEDFGLDEVDALIDAIAIDEPGALEPGAPKENGAASGLVAEALDPDQNGEQTSRKQAAESIALKPSDQKSEGFTSTPRSVEPTAAGLIVADSIAANVKMADSAEANMRMADSAAIDLNKTELGTTSLNAVDLKSDRPTADLAISHQPTSDPSKLAGSISVESKSVDSEAIAPGAVLELLDTKSDLKPTDPKPTDSKPTDSKPADLKPGGSKSIDFEPKSIDPKPADLKSIDLKPTAQRALGLTDNEVIAHTVSDHDALGHTVTERDSIAHGVSDRDALADGANEHDALAHGLSEHEVLTHGVGGQNALAHGGSDRDALAPALPEHGANDRNVTGRDVTGHVDRYTAVHYAADAADEASGQEPGQKAYQEPVSLKSVRPVGGPEAAISQPSGPDQTDPDRSGPELAGPEPSGSVSAEQSTMPGSVEQAIAPGNAASAELLSADLVLVEPPPEGALADTVLVAEAPAISDATEIASTEPDFIDPEMQDALRAQLFASIDASADIIPIASPELSESKGFEGADVLFVGPLIASLLRRGGLYLEGKRFKTHPRRVSGGLVLSAEMEQGQSLSIEVVRQLNQAFDLPLPPFDGAFTQASLLADTRADRLYFNARSESPLALPAPWRAELSGVSIELWRAPPGDARLEVRGRIVLGTKEVSAKLSPRKAEQQRSDRELVISGGLPFVQLSALLESLLGPLDDWWTDDFERPRELLNSGLFDLRFVFTPDEGRFVATGASDDFERVDLIIEGTRVILVLSPADELAPKGLPLHEAHAVIASAPVKVAEIEGLSELLGGYEDVLLGEYQVLGEVELSGASEVVLGRSELRFVHHRDPYLSLPKLALAKGVVLEDARLIGGGRTPKVQGTVRLELRETITLSGTFKPVEDGAELKAALESVPGSVLGLPGGELVGLFLRLHMRRKGGSTLGLTGWLQLGATNGPIALEVPLSSLDNRMLERIEPSFFCCPVLEVLETFGHEDVPEHLIETLQDARLLEVTARLKTEKQKDGLSFTGMMRLFGQSGYGALKATPHAEGGKVRMEMPIKPMALGPLKITAARASQENKPTLVLLASKDGIDAGIEAKLELFGLESVGLFSINDQGFNWTLEGTLPKLGFPVRATITGTSIFEPEAARLSVSLSEGYRALSKEIESRLRALARRIEAERARIDKVRSSAEDRAGKLDKKLSALTKQIIEERAITRSDLWIARRELHEAEIKVERDTAELLFARARLKAKRQRAMTRLRGAEQDASMGRSELKKLVREREERETWFAQAKQKTLISTWYMPLLSALKSVENATSFGLALAEQNALVHKERLQVEEEEVITPLEEALESSIRGLKAARGIASLAETAVERSSLEQDGRIRAQLEKEESPERRERRATCIAALGACAELAAVLERGAELYDERSSIELSALKLDVPLGAKLYANMLLRAGSGSLEATVLLDLQSLSKTAAEASRQVFGIDETQAAQWGTAFLEACSARLRYAGALRQSIGSQRNADLALERAQTQIKAAQSAKARADGAILLRDRARMRQEEAKAAVSSAKRKASGMRSTASRSGLVKAEAALSAAAISEKSSARMEAVIAEASDKRALAEEKAIAANHHAERLSEQARKDQDWVAETQTELKSAIDTMHQLFKL